MKYLLPLALLVAASSTFAQGDPCKTQRNTMEMNDCAQQTLAKKDKELNVAYQALVKSLKADDKSDSTDYAGTKQLLQQAQRAWVQFRDADCKAKYTLNAGGTIRDIVALSCQIEHTEQRTKELKDWNKG